MKIYHKFKRKMPIAYAFRKSTIIVFGLLIVAQTSNAQNLEFVKNISNSDGFIEVVDMAIDGSGNVFVAGQFDGSQTIDFDASPATAFPQPGAGGLNSDGWNDIYLAKYDVDGNFLWVMAIYTRNNTGNPNLDLAGIEIDASGNCYLAGHVDGTTGAQILFANTGSQIVRGTSSLGNDYRAPFIIAIDANGDEVWTINPNVSVVETGVSAIAISGANVVIAGNYTNGSPIGLPNTIQPASNTYAAAYSQSTGTFVSSERLLTSLASSENDVHDMEVDASGNLYITGYFENNTRFGSTSTYNTDGGASGRTYVAKFNSSYVAQWVDDEYGTGELLELANDGNVWVSRTDATQTRVIENWSSAGTKSLTSINLSFTADAMVIDSNDDIYLSGGNSASLRGDFNKYSGSTGSQIFAHDIGANAMTIDGNDKIYMSDRYSLTTDFDLAAGIFSLGISDSNHDLFLFSYNNETDTNAPSLVSLSPGNGSIDVGVMTNFILTFDENVRPISNTSGILKQFFVNNTAGGSLVDFVNVYSSEVSFSGNTITIDLADDLPDDTEMYLRFQDGFVIDYAGNESTGIMNSTGWVINTGNPGDITAPAISSTSPLDGAANVDVFTNLTITFDENVQAGSGNIYVRNYDNHGVVKTIDINGSEVTITGNNVTIDLPDKLPLETQLYVQIVNGAIQDLSGNNYGGTSGNEDWNFTTEAGTPPVITSLSPSDDTNDVAISGQVFTVTFNENVVASNANINLKQFSDNFTVENFNDADLTFNGNQISFTSTTDLNYESSYYITIVFGSVDDEKGSPFAGYADNFTWNFTTEPAPDVIAPSITSLSPADNATGIATDNFLYSITFDEDVQLGSGSASTRIIAIHRASDDLLLLTAASFNTTYVTITNNVVDVDFNADGSLNGYNFDDLTEYYLVIGENCFTDLSGNKFPGLSKPDWSFITESTTDTTPPAISSLNPSDGAVDIPVNNWVYQVTFDETIFGGSGLVRLKMYSNDGNFATANLSQHISVSGNTATIDFNAQGNLNAISLSNDTQYYIDIEDGVFEDTEGNIYSGHSKDDWDFTTASPSDVTPPALLTLSPMDDATDISVTNWTFTIDFDEDVQAGSGNISLKRSSDDALYGVAVPGSIRALISGTQVSIDFNADGGQGSLEMDPLTEYYVEIPQGAIEDLAGNGFAGIAKSEWSFTTESTADITAPSVTLLTPLNSAIDVSLTTDLVLTFDEDVQIGSSGTFTMYDASDDSQIGATWSFPAGATAIGSQVTYNIPMDLPSNTQIYFNISGGIEDLSGNEFAGITNSTDWLITTEIPDTQSPNVISLNVPDNDIDVSIDQFSYTLTFDEDVFKNPVGSWYVELLKSPGIRIAFRNAASHANTLIVTGNTATIDFDADGSLVNLLHGTDYFIKVVNIVEDASGNLANGWTDADSWNFTTEPELITWNGDSWSNGSGPSISDNVVINGDFNTNTDGNINANNLAVNTGVNISVDNGSFIEVNGDLTHSGTSFIVQSGGSLVTQGSIAGTNFTFERTTTFDENTGRYSVIGAPVSGADFNLLGNNAIIYGYDETQPYNVSGNEGLNRFRTPTELGHSTMQVGVGYFSAKTGDANGLISFSGTPNGGIKSAMLTKTDHPADEDMFEGFTLLSNPYPCALDFSAFINGNSSDIEGSIYIWDDFDSENGRGTNSDYVVVNGMGNVDSRQSGLSKWDGHIRSMQGFFVQTKSSGDFQVDFTDAMKLKSNNGDNGYYRTTNEQVSFKLTLENAEGDYSETLIGMREDASWGTDQFDARLFSPAVMKIYSEILGAPFAIQGIPKTGRTNIPIGMRIEKEGNYTISLDEMENINNYTIVLTDHFLNKSFDLLSKSSYTFFSGSEINHNRFSIEIINKTSVLAVEDQLETNAMIVFSNANNLNVRMEQPLNNATVTIYNINGTLLKQVDHVDFTGADWTTPFQSKGLFIIAVQSEKAMLVKKFVKK